MKKNQKRPTRQKRQKNQEAETLTLDIETSPLITYAWKIWEANAIKQIKKSTILCVSLKFLGEKKVYNFSQKDDPNWRPGVENDKWLLEQILPFMNRADIIVTQNGNKFDLPIIRTRMLINGIKPWKPCKKIDTKVLAGTLFHFESNSLKAMCEDVGTAQKGDPGGFSTWEGCMSPNRKIALAAFKRMIKYNNQDVVATEQLYLKMRPFMENHPNINVIVGRLEGCSYCPNTQLQARGWGYNKTSRYRRYQCVGPNGCGGWPSGKPEPVKNLVIR